MQQLQEIRFVCHFNVFIDCASMKHSAMRMKHIVGFGTEAMNEASENKTRIILLSFLLKLFLCALSILNALGGFFMVLQGTPDKGRRLPFVQTCSLYTL